MPEFPSFAIDSRTINPGDIFCALPGSRVDGHNFIADACARGAAGCIVSFANKDRIKDLDRSKFFIGIVPDTYAALCAWAQEWRKNFSCPVVGITGSVGKTSTKEILAHIFTKSGLHCLASMGNNNTSSDLSVLLLRMRPDHDIVVCEMGIQKRGEMALLADLVRPTHAIITSIGHSHMEGLGSLADIATEKRDIFKFFKEDSIGIINGDQPILSTIAYRHPIIRFGCKTTNQVQARKVQVNGSCIHFILKLYQERYKITLNTNHSGRLYNVLAAVAMANLLGVSHGHIIAAIQDPVSVPGRFESKILKNGLGLLIHDCYNASPESMKPALLAFEKMEARGPKIAVLGDMLELGVGSPFWHGQLGRLLRKVPSLQHVVLVGNFVRYA